MEAIINGSVVFSHIFNELRRLGSDIEFDIDKIENEWKKSKTDANNNKISLNTDDLRRVFLEVALY